MSKDGTPDAGGSLSSKFDELEKQFQLPELDESLKTAWADIPADKPLDIKLPKVAWERLLDTLASLPVLSVQSSTLAVLLSTNQRERAEELGIVMARAALTAQRNVEGIRSLLIALTVGSHHE